MTLEDFFTLTEMKNGLATLARVDELIAVMQAQKDFRMSNVGDAARQWSTVAGTIAATENKGCLNHFVQLNGLCFLNQWLQEALMCRSDMNDNTMEELVNALLGSLERLPMDCEKSTASGIWLTVAQLVSHKNISIKERARLLSEKWNQTTVINDVGCQNMGEGGTCQDDQKNPSADANTTRGISPCEVGCKEGSCGAEYVGTESHHSNVTRCPDNFESVTVSNVNISTTQITTTPSNMTDANQLLEEMNSLGSSLGSNPRQENSITEVSSVHHPAAGMASGICSLSIARQGKLGDQCDASRFKNVDDAKMEVEKNKKEVSPAKASYKDSSSRSSSDLSASLPVEEATLPCHLDSKESKTCSKEYVESQPRNMGADCGSPNCLRTMSDLKPAVHSVKSSQDLPSNGCILRNLDDSESYHSKEAVGSATAVEEIGGEVDLKLSEGVDVMSTSNFKKPGENVTGQMDQKTELGLECGEIDALEVARQVAIEVEREVVDYREPFCSSSPDINDGERAGVGSPYFEEEKQDQPVADDSLGLPQKNILRVEKCEQDLELPQSIAVVQGSDCKTERNKCDFDLNEDICIEELDCLPNPVPSNTVNFSVPIVVSASKGAPTLPVAPLQFQGELGWKGSAATSAFRPASPRRTPDGEKAYSGPKQRTNFLQIDLNVAESEEEVVVDLTSVKQIPVSSGFPSTDSYVEVSSRRGKRLKLDLNSLGDEDVPLNPSAYWSLHQQNGDQILSPASSSSSRQPSIRDFDLNDNPSFLGAGGSHNLSKSSSKASGTYGSSKLDDSDITIMGSRMAVERKDYVNGAQQSFFRNGPIVESTVPVLPYAHMTPAAYGYNGLTTGPAMPFHPAFYGLGSFPYMVDSRGGTVMPQILGSAGLNGAHSVASPFLMGVGSEPSSLNGVGSSRSGLDLNYGMGSVESGSREAGVRQFFMQGHYGITETQGMAAAQPVIPGMLKRKEPDCGWDPYAFGYKHVT